MVTVADPAVYFRVMIPGRQRFQPLPTGLIRLVTSICLKMYGTTRRCWLLPAGDAEHINDVVTLQAAPPDSFYDQG